MKWTQSRLNAFIKSALRAASNRYPPKFECKKNARVERGIYICAGYKAKAHRVPASLPPKPGSRKRENNVFVDHIIPVGGPEDEGSWNGVIERIFCPLEGLQILCKHCHGTKTADERTERKEKTLQRNLSKRT